MYALAHIDKTGGSTLKSILRRSFGTRHCDIRVPMSRRHEEGDDHRVTINIEDLQRLQRVYRNLTGIAGHNVKAHAGLGKQCPDIRFFTFLRDPVARFRSHFLTRYDSFRREDFDRWASGTWLHNWQARMIAGEPNAEKAIELISSRFGFVGLTDRFDESVLLLGQWLQEPGFRPEYRRLNQHTEHVHPAEVARKQEMTRFLYTDALRSQMLEFNTEDQQIYDYVVTTVFPRQIAAYDGCLESDLQAFQQRQQSRKLLAESVWSRILRNYVYKPLSHCRVA